MSRIITVLKAVLRCKKMMFSLVMSVRENNLGNSFQFGFISSFLPPFFYVVPFIICPPLFSFNFPTFISDVTVIVRVVLGTTGPTQFYFCVSNQNSLADKLVQLVQ